MKSKGELQQECLTAENQIGYNTPIWLVKQGRLNAAKKVIKL